METNIENATFICGHRKSGTTLLLCLLDNHPELLVYPADSAFFYGYYPEFESPIYSDHQKIERMAVFVANKLEIELHTLSESDRKELNFPLNAMRHDLRIYASETEKKSRDMLISLMKAYRKHFKGSPNAVRWLEKTTSSEIYAAKILEWFPNARFIHVIRDPRDNWASLKAGWSKLYYRFNDSPHRLMHQMIERGKLGMEFARNNMDRFGSDIYKIIKFEDIVTRPKRILNEICDFLNIRFSETMLIPTVCGNLWKGNNFQGLKFNRPSDANVGKWRERITEDEACLIEYHFGSLMEYFGYEAIYPSKQRMDAATMHYASFDAKKLVKQLCSDVPATQSESFPECGKKPESEFQDGIHIFKVSLGDIWRRIAIPAKNTLEQMATVILNAFDFDYDHICCFTYKDQSGDSVDVNHSEMNEGPPWIDEVFIGELPIRPGTSIRYLYDFADSWEFDVKLEYINPSEPGIGKPIIIETYGESPKQYSD